MNTDTKTEQLFLYVYREGKLLIVGDQMGSGAYDIPSWPFKGDLGPENAERLLADYFTKVSVIKVERVDSDGWACYVRKDTTAKSGKTIFFGDRQRTIGFSLTDRAAKAILSLDS